MTTANLLKSLLIAALLASGAARADESNVQVALEDGKTVVQFKVGDSRCVLIDDQVRCTPIKK